MPAAPPLKLLLPPPLLPAGVPDQRAVEITHNEVAQACRSLLVEAEAAYRAGDQQGEIMFAL